MFRRGYFRSNFDNLGWVFDSPSALGFDLNPVDPRFREAIGRTTTGFPYELWPRDWSLPFWRNMSVRCLLLREPLPSGGRRIESPGSAHYFYALDDALPRAYFQDRWAAADEDESLAALLGEDLRERGYCTREDWKARPGDCPPDDAPTAEEARRRFRSLQDDDLILRADFSDPNRLLIEAELARPAMLVLTDLWHPDWRARLDGREAEIRRVNYFQRGIWCRPGRHSVALEFSPPFRWVGPLLTAAGLLALLLVWRFRRRFRRGHPGA